MSTIEQVLPEPTHPFRWSTASWGPVLVCDALAPYAYHFFSASGLDVTGPEPSERWESVADALGVPQARVWRVRQVHGIDLTVADAQETRTGPCPEGDLLATERSDAALAVRTADCVPILLVDRQRRVVAAVHAGWRGTALGAAVHIVSLLEERYGVAASDLIAAVGPSIGPDRYVVGGEVPQAFRRRFDEGTVRRWCAEDDEGTCRLNLWQANAEQLTSAGVHSEQVHVAGMCTATHARLFHSYRVDGDRAGRMVAAIRLA